MRKGASKKGGGGRAAPRDPIPAGPKPFRPRPISVYFTEQRALDLLDLLRQKWYNEGKIPEPKMNLAIMHMIRNFGEAAQRPHAEKFPRRRRVFPRGRRAAPGQRRLARRQKEKLS